VAKKKTSIAIRRTAQTVLDILGDIPKTKQKRSSSAEDRAREIANAAASKAALLAGAFALPPGPWGWITMIPDLVAIWKLQAQMVADIAGVYGKWPTLTREQMLYCLFRHAAAQAVRDIVVRVGDRFLVRRATLRAVQRAAERVAVKVSQRAVGTAISRFIPIVGAVGVGAYAYYDTAQVAKSAMELFQHPIDLGPEPSAEPAS
jgi:hypothetical protein